MYEIHLTARDEERKLTHKHLMYASVTVDQQDDTLKSMVQDIVKEFGHEPDDVSIRIKMVW